jgi:hypothetical protein
LTVHCILKQSRTRWQYSSIWDSCLVCCKNKERTDERSHEWRVSFMVVGHGLDDCSISYRGKAFVSSMSGLAVGPTLPPIVWELGALSLWVNWSESVV